MRMFDVQGIEIRAFRSKVFDFVRDPHNLPRWAHAFESAVGSGNSDTRRSGNSATSRKRRDA